MNCRDCFCLMLLLFSSSQAMGQEVERPSIERRTRHTGVRRYRPGEWGVAGVTLTNREDSPVTVVTGVYFDGDEMTRYSRRFDVPAHSVRQTQIPVRAAAGEDGRLTWHPYLYRLDQNGTAVMMHASDDYVIDSESLPESHAPLTVVIDDWDRPDDIIKRNQEFAVLMRLAAGKTRAIGQLASTDIPAFPRCLDAADQIMLTGNRISESPVGLAALRSWLQRGGQLWIRLDQADLSTVEQLLGDTVRITEVDRTSLTEFQIWNRRRNRESGAPRQFDYPVELVRVIVDDVEVVHEIDGWPISFLTRVGEGRVLFTTMSDDGWIRRREPNEQAEEVERNSEYIAEQAFMELTDLFTGPLDTAPLTSEDFEPFLSARIGYRIPGRSTVLSILGLFCAGLIGAGFWLQRNRNKSSSDSDSSAAASNGWRLEWLALVGPLLACAASAPLVLMGQNARQAVPPSASQAEFVRVEPGSNAIHSTGSAAIFVPGSLMADWNVERAKLVTAKPGRMVGEIRQMVWTDLDEWHWSDFELSDGLQFMDTSQTLQVSSPIRAVASFGPKGLTGRLESEAYTEPTDALIASTADQVLAVTMKPDGHFTAALDGQLDSGVYVQSSLLTDQQRLQRDLLSRLLQPQEESRYPLRPTLLTWTAPRDRDISFPEELEQMRTSLLAVPLEIQPSPPGTEIMIPPCLLEFDSLPVTAGQKSTAYDSRTRQWIKTSYGTEALLRFRIPSALLPLDVHLATLELRLTAPGRTLTVASGRLDSMVTLQTVDEPSGAYSITLDQPGMLAQDGEGGLHVLINVSEVELDETLDIGKIEMDQSWKMDFVRLQLTGRTEQRPQNGQDN